MMKPGTPHPGSFPMRALLKTIAMSLFLVAGLQRGPVVARLEARLGELPNPDLKNRHYPQRPCWHLERARLAGTRKVPVELVVNGAVAARKEILADGTLQDLQFELPIKKAAGWR